MLVAVQLSVSGSYLPPVFKGPGRSAPDDHFAAGPDCRCASIGQRARWWCWWLSNYPCWDRTSRRCSNCRSRHFRPRRSFRCRSRLPCERSSGGRVGRAGGCPTVRVGIVSPAGVQTAEAVKSAPDDHFAAGPDCGVTDSRRGRVGGAGGCPTIRAGIISAAGVERAGSVSAPDDHFTAGPDCCVTLGRAEGRWWCWWLSNCRCWDYICRRCSKGDAIESAPDDHFSCRSRLPCECLGQRGHW